MNLFTMELKALLVAMKPGGRPWRVRASVNLSTQAVHLFGAYMVFVVPSGIKCIFHLNDTVQTSCFTEQYL